MTACSACHRQDFGVLLTHVLNFRAHHLAVSCHECQQLIWIVGVNMTLHKTFRTDHQQRITIWRDQFTNFGSGFGGILEQEFGAIAKFFVLELILGIRFDHGRRRQFASLEFCQHAFKNMQETRAARIHHASLF